jgi:bifunctional non-homologous end joining protein LigD
MGSKEEQLTVDGRRLAVSNLDKVLYPAGRFTKAQVIDYYIRIAKYLLPHLKNRPVTLKRFPNGIFGEFFYEKDAPSFTPDWVKTFPVPRRNSKRPDIRYILINDLPTLVWLANLANLEIHPFLHRTPHIESPTWIVFDLDPGEGANILACARVALILRDVLKDLGLYSAAKVSGSKGIQVYVPLNTPVAYDETRPFAKAIAELLVVREPKLIVSEMAKTARVKKVFIDWSQNANFKSTVSVYSLRAKSHRPFVSMPVEWKELKRALETNDSDSLYFDPQSALKRVEKRGDIFKTVLTRKQKLPEIIASKLQRDRGRQIVNPSFTSVKGNLDRSKTAKHSTPRRSRQGGRRRFVVHKHQDERLHYDLRLEISNSLQSWSLWKEPPYKDDQSRRATLVEDRSLDDLEFEGVSLKRKDAEVFMVWDIGTYDLIEGNFREGFLRVHLAGEKLKGEWSLKRLKDRNNTWQLIKTSGNTRAVSRKANDLSALTNRTLKQIEKGDRKFSNPTSREPDLTSFPKAKIGFIEPMFAKLSAHLPEGDRWRYEIKLDGYRTLVGKRRGPVTLYSRRGNIMNERFHKIAVAFEFLPNDTLIDGEVVALDAHGKPSFSAVQNSLRRDQQLYFYAFDLLVYQGRDLRSMPWSERRRLLEQYALHDMSDPVRVSAAFSASAKNVVAAAKEQGLEGTVAKRIDSHYEAGERSGAWLKYKTNKGQELVIGGYKPATNAFEYLLVGYYEGKHLIFVAKIKNGFTPALRRQLAERFNGLETKVCPFSNLPEPKSARRGEALTQAVMRKMHWLKPKLVAQIEFTEWTVGNHLRHSRFIGLRDDKKPREVVREDEI